MRVPQVSERIKEAPAQALRGVFAGIGQLLLVTDKLRNKAPAQPDVARARTTGTAARVADTVTRPAGETIPPAGAQAAPAAAETAAAKPTAPRRTPAKPATGKPAAKPASARPAATRRPAAKPATAKPTAAAPTVAEPAAAEPAGEGPKPAKPQSTRDLDKTGNVRLLGGEDSGSAPDAAAPLPNYDGLSLASLRARLRNLDVAQVRQLADYERAHAARDDVLGMFERRIAKLEAEPPEAGA
jgi:hypothetical protein